jgi:hypothetical protein
MRGAPNLRLGRQRSHKKARLQAARREHAPVLEAVREIILGTNPQVGEGIKWNAPSFHFKEYFATAGLQAKDFVRIVFHKGAKVKDNATTGMHITDPAGLLEWHAPERCSAKFYDMKDLQTKKAALQEIVKQWIKQM